MAVPIEITMVTILLSICAFVGGLCLFQKPHVNAKHSTWLPAVFNPAKREFEIWALTYTVIWIAVFMVVVASGAYEQFTENSYMYLCVGLAAPYLLQPIVYPLPTESQYPLFERYSFKANVWIAIFSFIGSYWYTHYFYTVLKARYTFPAHRLNDVPIALYFAAHFYFVTYHTLSNCLLRKVESTFAKGFMRTLLFWMVVIAFSYFTAFIETLSISSFPYYSFANRDLAYTLGSAFYGIYFLISFPVFFNVDEGVFEANGKVIANNGRENKPHTIMQTVLEVCGASMIVLCLLDFCRLACNIELTITGVGYYVYKPSGSDL